MDLRTALRLDEKARVAVVGAGGKTTALFQIAREYGTPVVITATTHMGVWQAPFADRHLVVTRPEDIEGAVGQIEGVTLVTGPAGADERLVGLSDDLLAALHQMANRLGFPLFIEADGARQRPLKAPAEHEPLIPAWVDTVIVVSGLSGIGKALDETSVHRPELFAALSGLVPGEAITMESLVKVLLSEEGGRKNIPAGARTVALLNQAERVEDLDTVLESARLLLTKYDSVLVAALVEQQVLHVLEPFGAVILAAGGSTRFGQPKVMLPWAGKPLVRIAAEAALGAGAADVVVVTGAADGPVRAALEGLPVRSVHNPHWEEGQSTSLRLGLSEIHPSVGSVVFLLADQPFVTSAVIRALVEQHEKTLAPVTAPQMAGRRGNPVLFDRVTFDALSNLQGDTGGRGVFDRFTPDLMEWDDAALLIDIDTPEDYARLMEQK